MKTIIREGGRLVIPAAYRKALGLKPGDEVLLSLEDGEIRVVSTRQAVARAQALVRRYVPEGRSLSEELIKERREEAARA
jgi:AbrB family looped-hinge helix DNA binding protein